MKKLLPILFFTFLLSSLYGQTEFCVDMNNYPGSFNTVYISGTFNAWSDLANPLSDSNEDGIWCATIDMPIGGDYLFQLDGFITDQERFAGGESCTISFNNGEFINRLYNGGASVCFEWNNCSSCVNPGGDVAGGDNGGGDMGGNTGGSEGSINFSVDMNGYSGTFTTVFISGTFNGWNEASHPLSDEDGDGIWSISTDMPVGDDYKFQVDGWADQENFTDGDPCTMTFGDNGEFINRIYNGGSEVCFAWSTCNACGEDGPVEEPTTTTTFSVDMNGYDSPFTTVYISGAFNGWSDLANPLSDEDGDGIWSGSVNMPVGSEYKFQLDAFDVQEQFSVGAPCTASFVGESETFTNRVYDGGSDICFTWSTCDACGEGGNTGNNNGAEEVTFSVDMNNYDGSFTTVYISGAFNGWSDLANPLSDEDGDGIWSGSVNMPVGSEYKFQLDAFDVQEQFDVDAPCTTSFVGESETFTNRVYDGGSDVCFTWSTCDACGSVGGGPDDGDPDDGGNMGNEGTTTTTLFADYSWLDGKVDPNNCDGTTILAYKNAGFDYVYVQTATSSILYNGSGAVWCTTLPNFNCLEFYAVDEVIEEYTCGGGSNDGGNTGGGNDDGGNDGGNTGGGNDGGGNDDSGNTTTLFADYSWLSSVVDPNNCEGTSILAYKSAGFDYLYVQTATSSILYNGTGTVYCTTLPNFDCLAFYTVDEVIEEYTCGGGNDGSGNDSGGNEGGGSDDGGDDGGTTTTLFADYSWLSSVVDPNNCNGTTIQVYQSAGYIYLNVITANSAILYSANGTLYCSGTPTYNCQDFYTVDEEIETYICGGQIAKQEIKPAFKTSLQGSNTIGLATEFNVYPNPSNGLFFVELTTNAAIERTLTILNMQGQIIQQQFLAATTAVQKVEMNLANQAAGMYFVRVSSKEGSSVERLIVK